MNVRKISSLLSVALVSAMVVFTAACGDDDEKVNCTKIGTTIGDLYEDYDNALEDENCEALSGIMDDIIAQFKKAKSCSEFKELLKEEGFDNADDYFESLEAEAAQDTEDCEEVPV